MPSQYDQSGYRYDDMPAHQGDKKVMRGPKQGRFGGSLFDTPKEMRATESKYLAKMNKAAEPQVKTGANARGSGFKGYGLSSIFRSQ